MTPEELLQLAAQLSTQAAAGQLPAGEIIHRLPPMIIDPVTFSADQVPDQVNWSLRAHKIPEVQKLTIGEGKRVAILDTGAWEHDDLPKPLFAENFTRSSTPYDMHGHGTHVAGTLGSRRRSISVAPGVEIGSCKVLGDDGSGSSTGIARGIMFAIAQRVDVISMSLGSPQRDPQIARAIKDAIDAGILVICAAGNDGIAKDRFGRPLIDQRTGQPISTVGYPARDAVSVGSFQEGGEISDFSSRGPEVDIAFPGEGIMSTWLNGGFKKISGTSQATPFAAGVAILRLAYQTAHPSIKPIRNNADLESEFRACAEDRGPSGRDTDWGDGVVDVMKFVKGGMADATPTPKPPVSTLPGIPIGPLYVNWPVEMDGRTGLFVAVN